MRGKKTKSWPEKEEEEKWVIVFQQLGRIFHREDLYRFPLLPRERVREVVRARARKGHPEEESAGSGRESTGDLIYLAEE